MSQPPEYVRQYSFTAYSQANPSALIPGTKIDQELNAAKQTLDAVRANLALIQRDDGSIANDSIGVDQMKPEVTLGLNSVADWVSGTAYVPNNGVWYDGSLYRCLSGHTADADFAVDLGAGRWSELLDVRGAVEEEATPAAAAAVAEAVTSGLIAKRMVETIAALKALPSSAFTDGAAVEVMGYHSAVVPGGGGTFVWSDASTAADNSGTVFRPTDIDSGSPGRWLRVDAGPLNVRWFGAKGDDVSDDTDAIQAAVDEMTFGSTLYFPPTPFSAYVISDTIVIPRLARLSFKGDALGTAYIRYENAGGNDIFATEPGPLSSDAVNGYVFEDLGFISDNTALHGLNLESVCRSTINRCYFDNLSGAALRAYCCLSIRFTNNWTQSCGYGILQDDTEWTGLNGWDISGNYIAGSINWGIDIQEAMTGSSIVGNVIEGNNVGGIRFVGTSHGILIDGNYFEENRTDDNDANSNDIYIGSATFCSAISIRANYFNGHSGPGSDNDFYYPICLARARGCVIENNHLTTGQKWIKVETDSNSDNEIGFVEFWGGSYVPPNEAQPSYNFVAGSLATFVNAGNSIRTSHAPLITTGFSKGRWPYGGWTLSTSGTGSAFRSSAPIYGAPALYLDRPPASTASAAQTFPLQVHMRGRFVTACVPIWALTDNSAFRVAVTPDGTSPITAIVNRTINSTGSEMVYATVWVPADASNLTVEVLTQSTGTRGIVGHVCVYVGCRQWYSPDGDNDWTHTAAPTDGTWAVGDYVRNSVPASGAPVGWGCSVAGSPGTFVETANYA